MNGYEWPSPLPQEAHYASKIDAQAAEIERLQNELKTAREALAQLGCFQALHYYTLNDDECGECPSCLARKELERC